MDQKYLASKVPKTDSRKPFKYLSYRQQLQRTDHLQEAIENWIESENNKNHNKGISEVGIAIFNGIDQQNKMTVPMESALALKHWIASPRRTCRK